MTLSRRHLLHLAATGTAAVAALAAGWPGRAHALTTDGLEFADTLRLGGSDLRLNGVGFRAVAGFKGYAAALYLTRRAATPAEVIATPGPKRLQLRLLLDVSSAEFSKALRKGVARNTPPERQAQLADRVQAFDRQVLALDKLYKGDVIDLDFVPGTGLTMTRNGRKGGPALAGDDLYAAVLNVFLGQRVSDEALKRGLLGGAA